LYQIDYDTYVCHDTVRPLQNVTLCPISASGSNFNPRNILYIPVVEIFAFLELEHKLSFFKGLTITKDGINAGIYKIQVWRFFFEHSGQNPTNSRLCPIISKTVAS